MLRKCFTDGMVTKVTQGLFITKKKKKSHFRYFQGFLIKMFLNTLSLLCSGNINSIQSKIQLFFLLFFLFFAQDAEISPLDI